MKELVGTGVALVTPFKEDLTVDVTGLERVVEFNIDNGIDYLVILGTTAESATLNEDEKKLVIDTVVRSNNKRLPLVLGIGGNNTAAVVKEVQTRDLSAFTAILSVSPFYNRPTQKGIYEHFEAIAKATSKAIIVYNVPGRTGSNMLPETTIRLANDFKNIIAIKEAAGDMVQAMKLILGCPLGFLVISGDDLLALPTVLAGGAGVISVIGQGFPKDFSQMVRHGLDHRVSDANKTHYKLTPIIDFIFAEGNPAGIKTVLHKIGLCERKVRLPLAEISGSLAEDIESFMDAYKS
jgi:4-hydroxy-tetrahydrodipicolinate synthase